MIEAIALIFVGWLLGLFGTIIIDAIRKRYQKEDIRTAIISELKEIQYRLACSVYLLNRRFGTINKQLLSWTSQILKSYSGAYSDGLVLEALERQLKLSDEQLESLEEIMKPDKSKAITLRKYTTPFLDFRIGSLSMFPPSYQLKLFEIKSQLGLLNDRIEDSKFYYRMTFEPNISTENYDTMCYELEQCYKDIADKSKTIADSISSCFH
ncbi:MAG: hypothetical protein ABIK26_05215 [Candidatus Omnitrophota bacterium]